MAFKRTFRVSTRRSGRRRFVRVTVYEDIAEMRRAAEHYDRDLGIDRTGEFDGAVGITHTYDRFFFDGSGEMDTGHRTPGAALIRLWTGRLGTSVIAHESAHAASGIYQQDCLEKYGSVHDDMENEEILCYLIGDLSARIAGRLYHYGYYAKGASQGGGKERTERGIVVGDAAP